MMKHISGFLSFASMNESVKIYKETQKLYISESTIKGAGKGLFTKVDLEEGDIISYFTGKLLTNRECNLIVKTSDIIRQSYLIDLVESYKNVYSRRIKLEKPILDVYDSQCMAKWANDAEGYYKTNKKNNAEISITEDAKRVFIYASKPIKAGSEIFLSYGKSYWEGYEYLLKTKNQKQKNIIYEN